MRIVKIKVLLRDGHRDVISVYWDVPAPFDAPLGEERTMTTFRTDATPGTALPWIEKHFPEAVAAGIVETIDTRSRLPWRAS